MIGACRGDTEVEAYLLCDHRSLRRYGLGLVKPFPLPIGQYLRTGYLVKGETISNLAKKLNIDMATLENTVATFNKYAREGHDPEFGKGETAYNRYMGDATAKPNPCVAPLEDAPFYAIKVLPGVLSTYAGLNTDRYGRVLSKDQRAIEGLYAVGSDMKTIMGGNYPAGGTNLGPHMTFGFIAGRHAAGLIGDQN